MKKTYLFYDLETTGLNKAFDQVLQFASIRTDLDLNEIERHEFSVKLNPDIIPSPGAVIIHRIGIKAAQSGINEYDAICKIHALLNKPGTISLGYNTLGFDDEFLRFSFYRHLLPPYTHQYANDCQRMDLYPIVVLYFLYKKEALNWPKIEGKTSLKLESLNAFNQLADGQAHNAMVDVEATLSLAKCLAKYQDMWEYTQTYFDKQKDSERIFKLIREKQALFIDGKFGPKAAYQSAVYPLGFHNIYKNQSIWLSLDKAELNNCTEENFKEHVFIRNKKTAESGLLLPFKERFTKHLTHEKCSLIEENRSWVDNHPTLVKSMVDYYKNYTYPEIPNVDAQAALYINGFPSSSDQSLCRQFHQAPPAKKATIASQLSDPILKTLAVRLLGRHFPDQMTEAQQQDYTHYQSATQTPIDHRGQLRLTKQSAINEANALKLEKDLDNQQLTLLEELIA